MEKIVFFKFEGFYCLVGITSVEPPSITFSEWSAIGRGELFT